MDLSRLVASVVVVAVIATGCGGVDDSAPEVADSSSDSEGTRGEPDRSDRGAGARDTPDRQRSAPRRSTLRRATPTPTPRPEPPQPVFVVTRVIDGDTVELGNGAGVRLVGIDTPEVGECGYEKASVRLAALVEGKQVRLTRSDEDTDRYGRLLRYVDVGPLDAGLRLVKEGLAIARYDSRDGYGFHPREPSYIAADRRRPPFKCPAPPAPAPAPAGGACSPGYTPCVPPYPPDVDCPDVNGPISVTGSDPHALDADGDGTACE